MPKTNHVLLFFVIILFCSCASISTLRMTNSLKFSGYHWNIKSHKSPYGPSQNLWSSNLIEVKQDQVYLYISSENGITSGSELVLKLDSLSYGYYVLHTVGYLDSLPEASVFGFFLYENQFPYREIDIEYGILEKASPKRRHYTVHDSNSAHKKITKAMEWTQTAKNSTHVIKWEKQKISFGTFNGHLDIDVLKKSKLLTIENPIEAKPFKFELHVNYWLKEEVEKSSFPKITLHRFELHKLD